MKINNQTLHQTVRILKGFTELYINSVKINYRALHLYYENKMKKKNPTNDQKRNPTIYI